MSRGKLVVSSRWPAQLVLVRHAQSVGNLASDEAHRARADRLDLDFRDADTPLSDAGHDQAAAVGLYLKSLSASEAPELVVASPYQRAADTAARAVAAWGQDREVVTDERLRERDLGVFDGLTGSGIRAEYADEAERRQRVGKFYYQPPSGESWCDVTLRVRSLLADLRDGYVGQRVWLFTHQAVIMSFRYVLEHLTEQELLEVDATMDLPNCSLTTYRSSDDGMSLVAFADTAPVDESAAEGTAEPSRSQEGSGGV